MVRGNRFLILGCLAGLFFIGNPTARADDTAAATTDDARRKIRNQARKNAEDLLAQERTAEFLARAKSTAETLANLQTETDDFIKWKSEILGNDDGKRLALDDGAFDTYLRLEDEKTADLDEVKARKQKVDSIISKLDLTTASPTSGPSSSVPFVPPPSMTEEIDKDRQWASSLRANLSVTRQDLNTAIKINKDADISKAVTLQARVDAYKLAKVESLAKSRIAGEEDVKPQTEQRVRDAARIAELERANAEAHRIILKQEAELKQRESDLDAELKLSNEKHERELADLDQKLAESEAARAVQNAKSEVTRDQGKLEAQQIKLKEKCQDPETKRLLAPFISDGLWQPGDRAGAPAIRDKGPMSLSAITKTGALKETERGLTQLYVLGNATFLSWPNQVHPDKDRPKWGYPRTAGQLTQDDWQELRHIQALLNELGPTLVDLGMLAK